VLVYQEQIQHVREAYDILEDAAEKLTNAFGKESGGYSSFDTLPRGRYGYGEPLQEVELALKKSCWSNLINRLGIRKVLSIKRAEELHKKLDNPKELPEITTANVFEMLDLLVGNAANFARESVLEVYNHFHCHRESEHLKTNLRNATEDLGRKIIVHGYVEPGYGNAGTFRVSYYRDNALTSLDRVFHILDGKPFNTAGYQSPLIDAINTCQGGVGETEYFKFKCYYNHNLHLEFKRLDLLKEFNRIANDGTQLKSGIQF